MNKVSSLGIALVISCVTAFAQTNSAPVTNAQTQSRPARPTPPTRPPDAPGTPKLTPVGAKPGEIGILRGAPGMNPPVDADGDFLIGPDYVPAPELTVAEGVPQGFWNAEQLTVPAITERSSR